MADPARYQAIKDELDNDPLTRGYSGMDDQTATNSLNNADRNVVKPSLTGAEVFSVTVGAELDALTDSQRSEWLALCAIDNMDPANGTPAHAVATRLFPASTTLSNLNTLRTETVSRAEELEFGPVVIGDIQNARAL